VSQAGAVSAVRVSLPRWLVNYQLLISDVLLFIRRPYTEVLGPQRGRSGDRPAFVFVQLPQSVSQFRRNILFHERPFWTKLLDLESGLSKLTPFLDKAA